MTYFKILSQNMSGWFVDNHKRPPDQEPDLGPPKHKAGMLTVQSQYPIPQSCCSYQIFLLYCQLTLVSHVKIFEVW